jgi:hypothetical protein
METSQSLIDDMFAAERMIKTLRAIGTELIEHLDSKMPGQAIDALGCGCMVMADVLESVVERQSGEA